MKNWRGGTVEETKEQRLALRDKAPCLAARREFGVPLILIGRLTRNECKNLSNSRLNHSNCYGKGDP
jgi:hypothetical protein